MSKEKKVHGNSKNSKKRQHIYEIVDSVEDSTVKYGVSGQKLNKNGTSPRANKQVNKWNFIEGFKRFFAQILGKDIEGRKKALGIEKEYVKEYKRKNNTIDPPPRQKRPNPRV